jgi:RNA polymerase sigma factor for flagellar operon FliA
MTTMYACPAETESKEHRDALILEHLPQVRLIARRIHERLPDRVSMDDLISSGVVGLIAAIDNFDPSLNVKLKTYAEYRIRGAIIDTLRDLDWAPRQRRKMSRQIEQAIAGLEQRLSRTPTEEEIAAELSISLDEYHRWLVDTEGLQIADLEVAGESDDSGFSVLRYVASPESDSPERLLERSELERLVASAIERIPNQERTILSLYYHEELNLREIAEILGLHLSRISQLKTQAILRLRATLEPRWPGRKEL